MKKTYFRSIGLVSALLSLLLVFTACGAQKTSTPPVSEQPAQESDTEQPEEENETEEAEVKEYPVVTITMENGEQIVVELYPDIAPESVKNFICLANDGFYDGLIFHRVISGFMIQGGDPLGTGRGGPGYAIRGEFAQNGVDNTISHKRGVISMARSREFDSAGSQFFIVHQDSVFLDGQYAAFGRVTSGMDTVDAIASVKTGAEDRPTADQVMATVRVDTFGVDYGEPEKLDD